MTFRQIDGFSGYSVNENGDVRNDITGRILRKCLNNRGYYIVGLCKTGKQYTKTVHQIVAQAFIPNPENKICIDHIDNNKTNNNIKNLRWVTYSENSFNQGMRKNNSTGFKGITFIKKRNKWRVRIQYNGINHHLGYFENIDDAVNARVNKANELFGEYTNKCEKIIPKKLQTKIVLTTKIIELFEIVDKLINEYSHT